MVRKAYEKNHVALNILGDLRDAENYFNIGAKDDEGIDTFREATRNRLHTLSESHPFELTQIIEKSRPIVEAPKVGRNDLYPCGSDKKYKMYCGSGWDGTLRTLNMILLKSRLAATDSKLKELKDAKWAPDKARRQENTQTKADHEREVVLVGEAVLRRLDRGEWDEADFRQMMDGVLSRPADRALFDLE